MKLCISEATTMPGTFAEDVANFADAGWTAMEVWLTKLETHLEKHSPAQTRKLLEDRQHDARRWLVSGWVAVVPGPGA